jgi:hypothetical protein
MLCVNCKVANVSQELGSSHYIPQGTLPKMILSLKKPPGSVVSGRDACPFQSLFLRST